MKHFLKWLFSPISKSKKYQYELIFICCLISIIIGIIFIIDLFKISNTIKQLITLIILIFGLMLLFLSILRIVNIADENQKIKIKNGTKKFKYPELLYKISDIEKWIYNSIEPDIIYVKGNEENKVTIIEVSFEYDKTNKSSPWINKEILINDKEIINLDDIKEEINSCCLVSDDNIHLLAITEMNNPKYFQKILEYLEK